MSISEFARAGHDSLPKRLISLRALEELYDVENTIRAYSIARRTVPDLRCDVFGGGSLRPQLEALAERLGGTGLTIHGEISRDELPDALSEGGILVNSSRVDNMPHVIIEAFAAGLPIVTTDVGGIPQMVEHETTALMVPPGRPADMAEAILRLIEDPDLARHLIARGEEEVAQYTWERASALWEESYRNCLAAPPNHA